MLRGRFHAKTFAEQENSGRPDTAKKFNLALFRLTDATHGLIVFLLAP